MAITSSQLRPAVDAISPYLASAHQGQYFRLTNPTIGTAIIIGTTASFSATAPFMILVSGDNGAIHVPHYLRLVCANAGAGATSVNFALQTDEKDRFTVGGSGGTDVLASIKNSRSDAAQAHSLSVARFGALTANAASSNVRTLARAIVKTQAAPCYTVGDEYFFDFTSESPTAQALSGSGIARIVIPVGPVVLGPNPTPATGATTRHSLLFHLWMGVAGTGAQFEFEYAFSER